MALFIHERNSRIAAYKGTVNRLAPSFDAETADAGRIDVACPRVNSKGHTLSWGKIAIRFEQLT